MKKFLFVVCFVLVYAALGYLAHQLIVEKVAIDSQNIWNWGWIIVAIQMVYFIPLSFRTVGAEEKGAVLLFERPMYGVDSGLVFVPWLICSLRVESRLTIQIQIPGEPEEIDKSGNDEAGLLAGKKFLPIRATTGSYEIVNNNPLFRGDPALIKEDPLSLRMTLEPTAQIRFKIKDIVKFIRTIGSVKEAKKQLRDTSEGVIKSEFAKRTPALIIAHWSDINATLKAEIEKLVQDDPLTPDKEDWGVVIETAQMIEVDISKKVNEALTKATEAKADAGRTITAAEAARTAAELAGKGAAAARLSLLKAEAKGQTKLAETAKTPEGQLALTLQTVRDTTEKAQYSIVGSDGPMGLIAGAMETLKKITSGTKPAPTANSTPASGTAPTTKGP